MAPRSAPGPRIQPRELDWVAQYLVRLAVFIPLYAADKVVALGVARAALTWPLVAACVALSWPAIRSALPPDHPGLRHPDDATTR